LKRNIVELLNSGALSFSTTHAISKDGGVENDIIISPLWSRSHTPLGGKMIWNIVTNRVALERLTAHVNGHYAFDEFEVVKAFQLDFKNLQNPLNSEEKNSFQLFYVLDERYGNIHFL